MKAQVNKDECTGCELCVETCPEVFEMGDDGVAQAKVAEVPAGARESCRQAAGDCPTEAITVEE